MSPDPRLERLRSLDVLATPSPWQAEQRTSQSKWALTWTNAHELKWWIAYTFGEDHGRADAALIAVMRNAWPAVVTLVEDVLELHSVIHAGGWCGECWKPWPCRNAKAALAVLDALGDPL
jgi:hypothetical protein